MGVRRGPETETPAGRDVLKPELTACVVTPSKIEHTASSAPRRLSGVSAPGPRWHIVPNVLGRNLVGQTFFSALKIRGSAPGSGDEDPVKTCRSLNPSFVPHPCVRDSNGNPAARHRKFNRGLRDLMTDCISETVWHARGAELK